MKATSDAEHESPWLVHMSHDRPWHARPEDESDGVLATSVKAYGRGDGVPRITIEVYATTRERAEHVWYYLRDVVAPTVWCDAPTPDTPEVTP